MNLKKLITLLAFILVSIIGVTAVVKPPQTQTDHETKLNVIATFYPLGEFASQVGKDNIALTTLIPSGTEPHEFEPKPQDVVRMQDADIILYNGAGLEPWLQKIESQNKSNKTEYMQVSEGLSLLKSTELDAEKYDPHIWLDPVLAQKIVDKIAQSFMQKDPQNKEIYQANAQAYKNKLQELDLEFRNQLASCQSREIVTSHNAFAYLAKRYDLQVMSIAGLSPEEEPSSQKMAEITNMLKEKAIKYIFFESLVSPRLSDTIAQEIGAQTLVFNPLEGLTPEEQAQGKNYISIQKENLANLKIALECQ